MGRQLSALGLLLAAVLSLASGYRVELKPLSTVYFPSGYDSNGVGQYLLDDNAIQKFDYEPSTKLLYVTGIIDQGHDGILHVVDASDPANLTLLAHKDIMRVNLKSAEACGGYVYVTYDSTADLLRGGVMVFRSYDRQTGAMPLVRDIPLGVGPKVFASTQDCREIVVPLDAPAITVHGQFQDPAGAVVIIHFPNGVENAPDVQKLDYTKFDSQYDALAPSGVRWLYRGTKFSDNLEGEAITLNTDHTKAYVALQNNNAIAEVDLVNNNITNIYGLGAKQWGELDPSDRDGGINIASWPVYGMYMPDEINFVRWNGEDYIITTNEGDIDDGYETRRGTPEAKRGNEFTDAEIAPSVDASLRAALRDNTKLGRHEFSDIDGHVAGSDSVHGKFYTFGGRGFSVWRVSDMQRVWDSGSEFERKTAELRPDLFNTFVDHRGDRVSDDVDKRSDNKGPETESMDTAEIGGRLLIFIGNERPGTLFVYSVRHGGMDPQFEMMMSGTPRDTTKTWQQLYDDRDGFAMDIEWIRYVPAGDLVDYPILLVAGAVDGTVTALKIEVTEGEGAPVG